ncbi:MAG: hypothetical protein V3V81_08125 [Candidatus Bathyarchaeia archaeon]
MSILDLKNKISRKWKESKERVEELEKQKKDLLEQKVELDSKLYAVIEEMIKIETEFSFLEELIGDDNEPVKEGGDTDNTPYYGK